MGDDQWQATMADLRERVARVEVKAEGVEIALHKFDEHLGIMGRKIDELASKMAQGIGAAKVGFWIGRAGAAVLGFALAHFFAL